MKKGQITGTLVALLIMGGCTTACDTILKYTFFGTVKKVQTGKKEVCVGTAGNTVNPVTWIWTPLTKYYYVNGAGLMDGSTTIWMVSKKVIAFQRIWDSRSMSTSYYSLYDIVSNKTAFVGTRGSGEDIKKNLESPDWKDPETEWERNTLRWLKDSKPQSSNYCN
jgi:hypothetical protein